MTVLAAIDDTAAARAVLVTAVAMARLLDTRATAVHVREDGVASARDAAAAAGLEVAIVEPPVTGALRACGAAPDVRVLVVGARSRPEGPLPAGHIALDLVTSLRKPVVVVPPVHDVPTRIARVLVSLDGTRATSDALQGTLDVAQRQGVDVIVLHVHTLTALPAVEEQPHHELEAWRREFIARSPAQDDERTRLELRVGIPGEQIVDTATALDVDLVALGWSRRLDRGHAAVVHQALTSSTVPLLLVPVSEPPRSFDPCAP
jgi:hypothetical protein